MVKILGLFRKYTKHWVCLELLKQQKRRRGLWAFLFWIWRMMKCWSGVPGGEVRPAPHTHTHTVASAHAAKSEKPDCEALEWTSPRCTAWRRQYSTHNPDAWGWGWVLGKKGVTRTCGEGQTEGRGERKIIIQLWGCGRPLINIHT